MSASPAISTERRLAQPGVPFPRRRGAARGRARVPDPAQLESLLVSKGDGETTTEWDFREFRDLVLQHGHEKGLRTPADISRAMGLRDDSKLSRWFRGNVRPTPEGIEELAEVTGAPYARLMKLAGRDPRGRLTGEVRPIRVDEPAVVAEIVAMFGPRSPLPPESREQLAEYLDRAIEAWRKEVAAIRARRGRPA